MLLVPMVGAPLFFAAQRAQSPLLKRAGRVRGEPELLQRLERDLPKYPPDRLSRFAHDVVSEFEECVQFGCDTTAACTGVLEALFRGLQPLLAQSHAFVVYGTLLGVIRDRRLIPAPDGADVDFALPPEDHRFLESAKGLALRFRLWEQGITVSHSRGGGRRVCLNRNFDGSALEGVSWRRTTGMPLRYFDFYEPRSQVVHGERRLRLESGFEPVYPLELRNATLGAATYPVFVPANSTRLLAKWYGTWWEPVDTAHGCTPAGSAECARHWERQKRLAEMPLPQRWWARAVYWLRGEN